MMDDSRPTVFKKIDMPKPRKIKVSVPVATDFKPAVGAD